MKICVFVVFAFQLLFGPAFAISQFPSPIKNIVVIVQENRTPDNLFHYLGPACHIPSNASGLDACTPAPVTSSCYNISPCGVSFQHLKYETVALAPAPLAGSATPSHSHDGFEKMCNPDPVSQDCRNDDAWKLTTPYGNSYAYVENTAVTNYNGTAGHLLDPYLTLAKDYGWANYMFQTNQGPSYPAHQFLFAGTSALTAEDDQNSTFVAEDFVTLNSGCLAPKAATNDIISPVTDSPKSDCSLYNSDSVQECPISNTSLIYPTDSVGSFCHSHQTMADVLDPKGISWKYYASAIGALATAPVAAKSICVPKFINPNADPNSALTCTGTEWDVHVDVHHNGADVFNDIFNCRLPRVSWVIPDDRWSDHAGSNDLYGPAWVGDIVNAVGGRQTCAAGTVDAGQNYWENTAIIVTWDDWGGWADHESPHYSSALPCRSKNCPGDYQHGFRVPLIVVSAYTPAGFISNEQYDAGSILRMIEGINQVPEGQLGFADKRATTDLHEFFTLKTPRKYTFIPTQKDATFFLDINAPAIEPDDD